MKIDPNVLYIDRRIGVDPSRPTDELLGSNWLRKGFDPAFLVPVFKNEAGVLVELPRDESPADPGRECVILSLSMTQRSSRMIAMWGPDNRGYRYRLQTAGRYSEAAVLGSIGYYNNGSETLAVPLDAANAFAVEWTGNDFDILDPVEGRPLVLLNVTRTWQELLVNAVAMPLTVPNPEGGAFPRRRVEPR